MMKYYPKLMAKIGEMLTGRDYREVSSELVADGYSVRSRRKNPILKQVTVEYWKVSKECTSIIELVHGWVEKDFGVSIPGKVLSAVCHEINRQTVNA